MKIGLSLENLSGTHLMSGKPSGLRKRLDKVEQQLADRARRAELANCNCKNVGFTVALSPEGFEAEMNLPCPAHGLRRLGQIIVVHFVASENDPEGVEECRQESTELDRLLDIYNARLAEQDSQKLEEDDAEEL